MPYVRVRGNQLVLVHGVRHPETKQVEQRIVHTWYTRSEAEGAVVADVRGVTVAPLLRTEIAMEHPGLQFDWPRIASAIRDHLDILPDDQAEREALQKGLLRAAVVACVRELSGCDAEAFRVSREALRENRVGLEFLAELVASQLELVDRTERAARPPSWERVPRNHGQPSGDVEEQVAALYERQQHDRLRGILDLLVEACPRYAEGHNYLGLIALDRREWEDAIRHFEDAAEIGRTLFGKRLSKRFYWFELATRPWIRARSNLGVALAEAGHDRRALALADKIDREVGERGGADEIRDRVAAMVEVRSRDGRRTGRARERPKA